MDSPHSVDSWEGLPHPLPEFNPFPTKEHPWLRHIFLKNEGIVNINFPLHPLLGACGENTHSPVDSEVERKGSLKGGRTEGWEDFAGYRPIFKGEIVPFNAACPDQARA